MQEDFKEWFKDLLNLEIPAWTIPPFDVEVESACLDTFLKEEFINMTFNLKAKSMYTLKEIRWTKKAVVKYPKHYVTAETTLLAFLSLYMVES